MTETSFYWDGLVTGDAVLAPYSPSLYHTLWKILFSKEDNDGVIESYLDALVVAGVVDGVSVASGAGLVTGTFYKNDEAVSVILPTPVTDPRIDRIVLQKIWLDHTVRITRVPGTEAASPTAPTLTQVDSVQWEIPLAQVLITTAGVITVTDEREFARTPLSSIEGSTKLIETITSSGNLSTIDFQNIPQTFKHLLLVGQLLTNSSSTLTEVRINGDGIGANYNTEEISATLSIVSSVGFASAFVPTIVTMGASAASDERSTQVEIKIANYTLTNFFKNMIRNETAIASNTASQFFIRNQGTIWKNTAAIDRITLQPRSGATFKTGSQMSLYGFR